MLYSFDGYVLDTDRRLLARENQAVEIEPQVFDVLIYLIENRHRVVSKDDLIAAVWHGRIVSDSTLDQPHQRGAQGDRRQRRQAGIDPHLGAQRRSLYRRRFGHRRSHGRRHGSRAARACSAAPGDSFCTTPDGVRIAYADIGSGPVLLKTGTWLTHIEYDWQSPVWRPFLQAMAGRYRFIRYDARGNGLSDWDVDDISLSAFTRDLESVVEATGLQRFPLFGLSQGCAASVAYAVQHPERVSHLILYGGYVCGRRRRGPEQLAQSDAMLTLMRHGWGQENPAFRQIFTSMFLPGGTSEQIDWFNDLQRMTTSPENAVRLRKAMDEIDISDLLPQVKVPTLVMHRRDDAMVPFEQGRQLAAGIKGARLVALEGRNHVILDSDPDWRRFFEEIDSFLLS